MMIISFFIDVKWTVIKLDYLKGSNKRDNIVSWVRFLSKLGVKQGIAVQRDTVSIVEVNDTRTACPSYLCMHAYMHDLFFT